MEDNHSLLILKTGSFYDLKKLGKLRNLVLPFFLILVFLMCLLFIVSVLLLGEAEVSCENDWTRFNQSCYKLVKDYTDIEVCREDCKKEGGDLASIHSIEENYFIISLLKDRPDRDGKKNTWIAGSITEEGGQFSWLDGSDWDFEIWDEGEPDEKLFGKTDHECVFLFDNPKDLGLWWDGVCNWSHWTYDCVCKN
eukprot:GFUD01002814.1.p1 GENE.GFUD01002814.1~~GFUD01002814.1.p1  ORF type:complete len:195 (-),score=40.35 GFUD01002814.1:76-660(-)